MDGQYAKIAEALAQVVQEEQPAEWTDTDIDKVQERQPNCALKTVRRTNPRCTNWSQICFSTGRLAQSICPNLEVHLNNAATWKPIQQHQLYQRLQLLREPAALASRVPEMSQILSATAERPRQTARPQATDAPTREKPQPPAGRTQTEDLQRTQTIDPPKRPQTIDPSERPQT